MLDHDIFIKQSQHIQLQNDIDKWLEQGNKIKCLERGFSEAVERKGLQQIIMQGVTKQKQQVEPKITKELEIAMRKEQAEQLAIFEEKSNYGDKTLLSRMSGLSVTCIEAAIRGKTKMKKSTWEKLKPHLISFN